MNGTPYSKGQEDAGLRLLFALWLTTSLTMLGVGLVAAILWKLTPPVVWTDILENRYSVPVSDFYLHQPGKNIAFETGCLLAPFFIGISYFLARRIIEKIGSSTLLFLCKLGIGISWLFFLWCLKPVVYCPKPPFPAMPPCWLFSDWFFEEHPSFTVARFCFVAVVIGLGWLFWKLPYSRRNLNITLAALVLGWTLAVPAHLYAPVEINDHWKFTYHFNTVLHALSQVTNGYHLWVDFSDLYGGYVELLGPVMLLFPRCVETPLLLFAGLNVAAVLGLLITARLVIRKPFILFLTGLSLLGIQFVMNMRDHYYQYYALRMIFPSLGLLVATLYLRNPSRLGYGAMSLLAAVAPIWNLDMGLVLWLSWVGTLMAIELSNRSIAMAFKHVATQAAILVAVWMVFILYLRLVSGQWPDLTMVFRFQRLYIGLGYFCVGMTFPDCWVIVLIVYLVGLVVAFVAYLKGISSWKTHFILMLSLMGVGYFNYFMGRSAASNLLNVGYVAILLTGVFMDEAWSRITLGKLPRMTWAFLLPAVMFFLWWPLLFTIALPELVTESSAVLHRWQSPLKSPMESNAALILKWTVPHEKVFILSNHSGFYHYLSDTLSPLKISGPQELFWTEDIDKLVAAIDAKQIPKLFVEQDFYDGYIYKPKVYREIQQAIAQHYRAIATSDSGYVVLYQPR